MIQKNKTKKIVIKAIKIIQADIPGPGWPDASVEVTVNVVDVLPYVQLISTPPIDIDPAFAKLLPIVCNSKIMPKFKIIMVLLKISF